MSPRFKPGMLSRTVYYGALGALLGIAYAMFVFVMDRYTSYEMSTLHIFIAPVVAALFASVFGHEEDRIRNEAGALEQARVKFASLTHSAITEDDWDVNLHDTRFSTCWEVTDCDVSECVAYGKHHMRCWLLVGTYCRGKPQGRFAQKIADCVECQVYKDSIGTNPIDQIDETFKCLIWALREKEELLKAANVELEGKYQELELLQKKTREAADTDGLTGLRNYGHFRRFLKKSVTKAKRYNKPLSLVLMDLDQFKTINNEFGFMKGDQVLKAVGALLVNELREIDYAARYGGEEFVILMPEIVGDEAVGLVDNIRRRLIKVARDTELAEAYLAASFGIADIPDCASDAGNLISAADTALIFARRKEGSRIAYFCDLSETELEHDDLARLSNRLDGASPKTLSALAEAVNVTDRYTGLDTDELSAIAVSLGRDLGMNYEQTDSLVLATKLHDIGKIGVPGSVLRKTDKLSPEELKLVKQHPEIGQKILQEAQQIKDLISAILYHHECWDGEGYPEKLKGEEIPLMARIVGIFDAYRAMRSDRPYRKALSKQQALAELRKGAGTQFDPHLVEQFLDLVSRESCDLGERAS